MIPSALVQDGRLVSGFEADVDVPWWSFSKTVIAAAALVLVSRSRLVLDEPVWDQPFTLRQLLRHEAGLTDYGDSSDLREAVEAGEEPWSAREMLERTGAARLRHSPGEHWRYSNIGYLHVRQLIEQATAEDLDDALRRLVFDPLEIESARVPRTLRDLTGVRMGAERDYDPGWVYHGLVVGSLSDAARLLNALIAGHLLPRELLDAMVERRQLDVELQGRPWRSAGYGLGLMMGTTTDAAMCVGHTGQGPGSVVAVYHVQDSRPATTAAAFALSDNQGEVEDAAVRLLP